MDARALVGGCGGGETCLRCNCTVTFFVFLRALFFMNGMRAFVPPSFSDAFFVRFLCVCTLYVFIFSPVCTLQGGVGACLPKLEWSMLLC